MSFFKLMLNNKHCQFLEKTYILNVLILSYIWCWETFTSSFNVLGLGSVLTFRVWGKKCKLCQTVFKGNLPSYVSDNLQNCHSK